jgi:hypothetical protein
MGRILVDFARARRSLRRGGDAQAIQLDEALVVSLEFYRVKVALQTKIPMG